MPVKETQFDLLSSEGGSPQNSASADSDRAISGRSDLSGEGLDREKLLLGTVTEYKLPNRDLLPFLQQQVADAQSQKADRWTTIIASGGIIKPLSTLIRGQSPGSLLLTAQSHQESFSITRKALASGQSKLVIAYMITQTLAEQLALQSAARQGDCCGVIVNCY